MKVFFYFTFFTLTLLSFSTSLQAREISSTHSKRSKKSALRQSLEASSSYLTNSSESLFYLDYHFKYQKKLNKNLAIRLAPRLSLSNLKHSKDSFFYLQTEDSGLYYRNPLFILALGLLGQNQGLSQAFSPLSFVDSFNYNNPFDPQKIASPSLRLSKKSGSFSLFLSYMPYRFTNLYPGGSSHWIPNKGPEAIYFEENQFLLPQKINYSILEGKEVKSALTHNYYLGLKFKNKSIKSQILFYEGLNSSPSFLLGIDALALSTTSFRIENPIRLQPLYDRIQNIGGSFRYTLPFKWRVLYEFSYSKSLSAPQERRNRFEDQHTLGLEWGIPLGKTLLLGVIQYYRAFRSFSSSFGLVSPVQEALLFGAQWKYHQHELHGAYLNSYALKTQLIQLGYKYQASKTLSLQLSYNLLEGELTELLSAFLEKDHLTLKLSLNF